MAELHLQVLVGFKCGSVETWDEPIFVQADKKGLELNTFCDQKEELTELCSDFRQNATVRTRTNYAHS